MGLMDVLNGMQNGPRGPSEPGGGGMSPITMALLGLLAYKAVKKFGADNATSAPPTNTAGANLAPGGMPGAGSSGGLGGMLGGLFGGGGGSAGGLGGLGGLLTGGAAGGLLSGGLKDLVDHFQNAGQGQAAQSWVSNGPNQPIDPSTLESALGDERIDTLARQTGMSRNDLLNGISQYLPQLVNHLTPNGRLPTEQEMSKHL